MLIYYFWNIRYVGILVAKSASEGGTGETSAPLSAVVINGIKILLGQPVEGFYAERQSQFTQAMADMGHQFWTSDGRLSMIGQGRNVVVLILLVFLVAAICARGRQLKLRIGCIGVLSLACFVGYNLMLALSYGFISSRIRLWGWWIITAISIPTILAGSLWRWPAGAPPCKPRMANRKPRPAAGLPWRARPVFC